MSKDKLYHATTREIKGDSLWRQHKETASGTKEMVNAVFVSDNEQMAYAYALKTRQMMRCGYHEGRPLIICYDRDKFLERFTGGTVFVFDKSDDFRQVTRSDGTPTSEWLYEKSDLAIDRTTTVKVDDIAQVLAKDADIFFLNKVAVPQSFNYPADRPVEAKERAYAGFIEHKLLGIVDGGLDEYYAKVRELVEAGILVYENLNHDGASVAPALTGVEQGAVPDPIELVDLCAKEMNSAQDRRAFAAAHRELSAPSYAMPTTSSLLKVGDRSGAMRHDNSFAEKVLEERAKAEKGAKMDKPKNSR